MMNYKTQCPACSNKFWRCSEPIASTGFWEYVGIYDDPEHPAIVPDGFLSWGVERIIDEELRLSYVLWAENHIPLGAKGSCPTVNTSVPIL